MIAPPERGYLDGWLGRKTLPEVRLDAERRIRVPISGGGSFLMFERGLFVQNRLESNVVTSLCAHTYYIGL